MLYIGYTALACCCSIITHLIALRLFPRLGWLDFPERYGHKRAPIPYPTGSIAVLLFCIFLLSTAQSMQDIGLAVAIVVLGLFSFIDDRKELSAQLRFIVHILVAIIVFITGTRIYSITSPLAVDSVISLNNSAIAIPEFGTLPLLSGIFTLVWIVLTINALNWFDGIPGQVQTISLLGFCVIGALALSSRITHIDPASQQHLATLAFFLAGLSIAGLLFDIPVRRVVLGDTGAMFYGLMLGILTIYSGGKVATAFLVLGVPLLDSAFVICRRLLRKKKPWEGNMRDEHLHHRLLECGWKPIQVIALFTAIGGTFGISALYLSTVEKFIASLLLLTLLIILTIYTEVQLGRVPSETRT